MNKVRNGLREITIENDNDVLTKRWFSSTEMDLFIWFDAERRLSSFQLTVDKQGSERAIIWDSCQGLSLNRVEGGSRPGRHPGSPIFVPCTDVDLKIVSARFKQHAVDINTELVGVVLELLSTD